MARFWVGGTGNWDASTTTNWSETSGGSGGASVPTSSDDVTFDTASNGSAYTVTITATANCANLTIGNPASGSLTLAGSSTLNVFGSFNIANITRTFTGAINFSATTTGKTLTFNGETMASATTFNGVGGGWTVQDAWNNGSSNITLTNGSLDTNGQTITAGSFASSNSNTRSLTLGASTITLSSNSSGTINFSTITGLTFNVGTSTIVVDVNSSVCVIFPNASLSWYNFSITGFTGPCGLGTDLVVTNNLAISGTSITSRCLLYSDSSGLSNTQRTITANAITALTNTDFVGIIGAGTATWTGTSLGDGGNNSGITFTTPVTRFKVGGTGSWSSTTMWSATSGGASGASVPLIHDTITFDSNSFSAGGQTLTMNIQNYPTIDFTNVTNDPTVDFDNNIFMFGGFIVTSGMTTSNSFAGVWRFWGRNSYSIGTNGVTWNAGNTIVQNAGTLSMTSHVVIPSTITLNIVNGTFDANDFNLTCGTFSSNVSSDRTILLGSGTLNLTGTGSCWSFATLTGLTFNAETSTIKFTNASSSSVTFSGSGLTYNNLWFARGTSTGSNTISGSNTFAELKDDGSVAHSILFTAGTTQTVSTWTVSGTSGNVITLNSTSAGTDWNISKSTGNAVSDFLTIRDSNALGGATWYAGANSTSTSNNTGWHFNAQDSQSTMLAAF